VLIRLGEEVARCARCGSTEFAHMDPGTEMNEFSELLCAVCEAPVIYAELVVQIGPRALAKAARRLGAAPAPKLRLVCERRIPEWEREGQPPDERSSPEKAKPRPH
jgi:hypothetical protein